MAYLREYNIRSRARRRAASEGISIDDAVNRAAQDQRPHYDIFLSQTIREAEIVLGVYDYLTEKGFIVFCDWVDSPEADRSEVTPSNAAFIREAMNTSDTLLFLDTESADQSLWMCWELGWFDGRRGRVGILPVLSEGTRFYRGREFLGLYPYVEEDDDGELKVVRPVAVGLGGTMIFEAPNSRKFRDWSKSKSDFLRPRTLGSEHVLAVI